MAQGVDERPALAVGHVMLKVNDIAPAAEFFEALGLRPIFRSRAFAVLELRGGTHLVLTRAKKPVALGRPAPFDLMVDDVDAARRAYQAKGFKTSRISRGRIHDSFMVRSPDGYEVEINSSHASGQPV
ncbi:MAG: VOC family protein [Pseudomonadota bacterium]